MDSEFLLELFHHVIFCLFFYFWQMPDLPFISSIPLSAKKKNPPKTDRRSIYSTELSLLLKYI